MNNNRIKNGGVLICQVALLWGISLIGDGLSTLIHKRVPGSILGLILLLILLALKIVRIEWFQLGASFLTREMLLFFVPTSLGIINYGDLFKKDGIQLCIIVFSSTLLVMVTCGLLAKVMTRGTAEDGESV